MKRLKSLFLIVAFIFAALFSACAKEETLNAPGKPAVNVDNVLEWNEVDGARTYTVQIENAVSAEKEEKNVRKPQLDLAFLSSGDYVLRVRANSGTQDSIQSAWSEGLEFHMNYTTGCVYQLINNNSEYEIQQVGTSTTGVVMFEDEYRSKPVTSIAENAFRGSSRVTGIVLGKNIRSVGKSAFYNCGNLETVSLNDSLRSLGAAAFQNCNVLKTINIPDGLTAIEDNTFGYCYSMETIEIGKNVQTIGASAFSNCVSLKEIVLPDSVTSVGTYAFYADEAAEKLTIGKNLQTIGASAFHSCSKLAAIKFYGENGKNKEKGSLKEIGSNAFANCIALISAELPDTLETIGEKAFFGAENLEKLKIPDSVTRVGGKITNGTKLAKAQEENGFIYTDGWLTQITDAKKKELSDKENTVNLNVAASDNNAKTSQSFDENTRGIAAYTFAGCTGLVTVKLTDMIKTVGAYAFAECSALQTVRATNKNEELRLLDTGAFAYDESLSVATFPVPAADGCGLQTIGDYAFYQTNIGAARIPYTVTKIGKDAYKDSSLWKRAGTVVYADGNDGDWVVGHKENAKIGSLELVDKKGIADYAFSECNSLDSVTVSVGEDEVALNYIGKSAFYSSSLKSINLGDGITEIQDYTFYGAKITSITFPRNLKKIGRSAFYKTPLTSLDFSTRNLETIGDYAFFSTESLGRVKFGNTLKEIGNYAFYGCLNLDLTVDGDKLPDTLEKIGAGAFGKCESLTSVTFGNNLKEIGDGAFRGSTLSAVTIPDSVEKIGAFAFYGDEKIGEVNFGNGLKEIGAYAFYGVNGLKGISLPAALVTLGNYAFRECENLEAATIASSVSDLGFHSFYWCESLTVYTDADATEKQWLKFWNSSYRPVVYGCTLSEDKSYVVSFVTGGIENATAAGGVSDPYRKGYLFGGWSADAGAAMGEYTTAQAAALAEGTTLYAVWKG